MGYKSRQTFNAGLFVVRLVAGQAACERPRAKKQDK
jgi:hypothetical protein